MTTKSDEAKQAIRTQGITIKEWARQQGFPLSSVRAVLSGHNKGLYGQSHRIAVALGMKEASS